MGNQNSTQPTLPLMKQQYSQPYRNNQPVQRHIPHPPQQPRPRPPPQQIRQTQRPPPKRNPPQTDLPQRFVPPPARNMGSIMPYPESSGSKSINPLSVQDQVQKFNSEQQNEESQFLQNIEKQKADFYKKQSSKKDRFKQELEKFEKKFNPFKILSLNYDASEADIKKAYRKLSLKYHPDREGGNPKAFQLITQSYLYLIQKIKESKGVKSHSELRKDAENFFEEKKEIVAAPTEVLNVDDKSFDNNKFNKIFEKTRMPTIYDKGYGEGDWDEDDNEDQVVFNKKFNLDVFNSVFQEQQKKRAEKKPSRQMIKIDEPSPQISTQLQFEQLGLDEVNDFSSTLQDNMAFTDYKAAYTQNNTLAYDEEYKRRDYKNLNELKMDRDNISYQMSQDDEIQYQSRKRKEEEEEQKRIRNLMAYDQMAEDYRSRANRFFIKNN